MAFEHAHESAGFWIAQTQRNIGNTAASFAERFFANAEQGLVPDLLVGGSSVLQCAMEIPDRHIQMFGDGYGINVLVSGVWCNQYANLIFNILFVFHALK